MRRAVVLLSGGLDSATAAAMARREGWTLLGLTVRYGQVHDVEIEAARRVAASLGLERHVELDVDLKAFGGSALVGDGVIRKTTAPEPLNPAPLNPEPSTPASPNPAPPNPAPEPHPAPRTPHPAPSAIPTTYVPARNTVLLSLALAFAEVEQAECIVIGVNALDYSGYPDCRPEFIAAFEYLATLATKAGVEGRPLRIWAPLQHLSKAAIVRVGLELGVDYALTHSCYDPGPDGRPCLRCDSCVLRARGFAEAGVPDPAGSGWSR
jgi:7-cyano-7-deazaguanine synthase